MTYVITMFLLVLLAHMANIRFLRDKDNALLTNFRVLRDQVEDYGEEVRYVIVPGIKQAKGLGRKVHKISAFGEEFVDRMPRLVWYTAAYGTLFTLVGGML